MIHADLHLHSIYSDGRDPPLVILKTALKRGLNVVSITDHDTFAGSIAARSLAAEHSLPIMVLYGIERRTVEGDVLVYCWHPIQLPKPLEELIDRAKEEGCLVYPAHPYDFTRMGVGERVLDRVRGKVNGIECFNAGCLIPEFNRKAYRYAISSGLPCLSNSDAHVVEYVGLYRTLIEAEDNSEVGVMKALHRGLLTPRTSPIPFTALASRLSWSFRRRLGIGRHER